MPKRVYRVNATRLDFHMKDQDISATRLARAAGHADHSYIARMRRGERRAQSATKQTAEAISQMLGFPMDYLFTEIDPRTGRPLPMSGNSKSIGMAGAA